MNQNSAAATVDVYLIDLNGIPEERFPGLLARLSESEVTRFHQFRLPLRQRQFLTGRIVLRCALSRMLRLPVAQIELAEQAQRAPQLIQPDHARASGFSISHSGNWVAVACSQQVQLGLDIELLNPDRNLAGIAEHSFSKKDVLWFQSQPDPVVAFYQLWSSKEARYKLTQGDAQHSTEHRYLLSHPTLSMVLMADAALPVAPEYKLLDWSILDASLAVSADEACQNLTNSK